MGLLQQIWPWPPTGASGFHCLAQLPPQIQRPLGLSALALDLGVTSGKAYEVADQLQTAFALSNDERDEIAWLIENRPDLGQPALWRRSTLKKLIADPRWPHILTLNIACGGGAIGNLEDYVEALLKEGVAPAPFITGDDLIALGAQPGPNFKRWLDTLYDRQLELEFTSKDQALAAAQQLVANA